MRENELLSNCIEYISELENGSAYIGTLLNSIGFTEEELIRYGVDTDDIEDYKSNK